MSKNNQNKTAAQNGECPKVSSSPQDANVKLNQTLEILRKLPAPNKKREKVSTTVKLVLDNARLRRKTQQLEQDVHRKTQQLEQAVSMYEAQHDTEHKYVNQSFLAARYGCHRSTIYRRIKKGAAAIRTQDQEAQSGDMRSVLYNLADCDKLFGWPR